MTIRPSQSLSGGGSMVSEWIAAAGVGRCCQKGPGLAFPRFFPRSRHGTKGLAPIRLPH